jgi:hypothetical protein
VYPCAGTIFQDSRTPLRLWFYAIYLFVATRHGVSGKELERSLGVTYKTAWRMEHFGWAETAKTERERAIFFQMAAAWLEVAQRWEASARNASAKRCDDVRFSLGAHTVGSPSAPVDQGGQPCAKGNI